MRIKRVLLLVAVLGTSFVSVPAHAASGTLASFDAPAPEAGNGCTRHTEVHYDTTKVPPVWSSGYVVCNG